MTRIDAETLREWRRARGWDVPKMARQLRQASNEPIAAHEGLVRMIRAWERGEHQLSGRYELLYAAALGVSPQELHHGPRHQRQEDQPGVSGQPSGPYAPEVIAAIGEALHADQHSAPEDLYDPASVRSDILRAWELRQSAQYVRLGALLTGLLQDTAAWLASSPDDSQALDAATAAVHTQDMVSSLLKRLGAYQMAAIVADRAFRIGRQTGNALLIGAAQLRVANVYLSASRHAEAVAVAAAAAESLPPRDASPPAETATFGALLLTAAVAAARMGETAQAWEFLGHAKTAALITGHEHADLFAVFGPVNLAVHGVQVATELGDSREALRRAASVDADRMPPVLLERRSTLLIDIARSHHMRRAHGQAAGALLRAEHVAPLEVRYNSTARQLLGELLVAGAVSADLREMASRLRAAA
jgi:tetratricopeptide (TPR) repeat protein